MLHIFICRNECMTYIEVVQMKSYSILILTFICRKTICCYCAAKETNGSSQTDSYIKEANYLN